MPWSGHEFGQNLWLNLWLLHSVGNSGPIILGQNVTPLVFDVFYLHKYSHGFSNFNDIVIQFFWKTSVMAVATLELTGTSLQSCCPNSTSPLSGWIILCVHPTQLLKVSLRYTCLDNKGRYSQMVGWRKHSPRLLKDGISIGDEGWNVTSSKHAARVLHLC